MRCSRPTNRSALTLVGVLVLTACPDKDDRGQGDGTSTGSEDSGSDTTSTGGQSASETSGEGSSTTDTSTGPGDSSTTGPELSPDGEDCFADADCRSGHCFQIGLLGAICGECSTEADCEGGGCSPPNPLAVPPTPSFCNNGRLGEACNTSEVCADGLACIEVASIPQVVDLSTCSECASDADCGDAKENLVCAPVFDIPNFRGSRSCVLAASVPSGQGCDLDGSADAQCLSGICNQVNVLNGLFTLGVCGDCRGDADCTVEGEECLPVNVDSSFNVIPARCGVP